jgi:hypothetical protein
VTSVSAEVNAKAVKFPLPSSPLRQIEIDKSAIPAGDFVTLMQFQTRNGATGFFGLKAGRQTTCVPEYLTAPDPAALR